MKKALWWIMGILLSPILLFLILTVLIYLPPVQNWVVDKVAQVASEKTGLTITIDHVNLSFPLDLGVDGMQVVQIDSVTGRPDTLMRVDRTVVDRQPCGYQSIGNQSCASQYLGNDSRSPCEGRDRSILRHQSGYRP